MKYRFAFLLLLLVSASAVAQDDATPADATEHVRAGVIGAGTLNRHKGEFTSYDGLLECAVFNDASTLGWQAGYIIDFPLSSAFGLSGRLYYWKADGDFTSPNPIPVRVAIDDNTTVPLSTEHTLEASLDYVMLDALLTWRFAKPFYLAAGPSAGFAARAAYEQEERILSPQGITFQNGESARNIIAGNFDEQGTINTRRMLRVAATVGLGAEIPVSSRLTLNPEVGYSLGLTSVLSSFDWKVDAVRAAVTLTYAFGGEVGVSDPPMPRPVLSFDAKNQLDDGSRQDFAEVTVMEDLTSDLIPLLPYVFFAPNNSDLAPRYKRLSPTGSSSFSEGDLRDSVIDVYYHVLNIIGSRLQLHPEATITVTGCREPLDDSSSTDALSAARAATVKGYLVSVWNISPDRIGGATRVLPEEISNRSVGDGREENRRAEISSSDPRILAPVTRRFGSRDIDPAAVAIIPSVQFGEGITGWNASIRSKDGKELWRESGVGAPTKDLLWKVEEKVAAGLVPSGLSGTAVTASFEATTMDGETIEAERQIPVRRITSARRYNGVVVRDSILERYNLMFFDFDTPRISDFNRQVVGLVQNRMRTNSSVGIVGLTDRIGETEYNNSLSLRRATALSEQIRSRIVPERVRTEGAGEYLIYNNDLPEGRMYNRTVIIEITTPLEQDAQ